VSDDGSCELKHVAQYYVILQCCVGVYRLFVAFHVKSLDLIFCFSSIIHTCYITTLACHDFIHHIIFRKKYISETGSVSGGEKVRRFLITEYPAISLSIAWVPTWSILNTQFNSKQFWQQYTTFRITRFLYFVHCLILKKQHISETGSVPVLRGKGKEGVMQLGLTERASLSHFDHCSSYFNHS
jgi:amino acid permease